MKKTILVALFVIVIFIIGCANKIAETTKENFPEPEAKIVPAEITATGQKELRVVISPSIGNTLSNEITIKASSVPAETTAIAFVLVPSGEEFILHHILGWDDNGDDGWSYGFDTSNFYNGDYSLMTMAVKQMGEQPLDIASAKVAIQNEETGFIPPPATEIEYWKSLTLTEYTASRADVKRVKELGGNMITLAFNLDITEDNQVKIPTDPTGNFRHLKKKLSNIINEAHQQGLQVELRTVMVPESVGATDTEKLLANMLPFIQGWAKFAEEHKVYSFTTFGEVDNTMLWKAVEPEEINKFQRAVLSEVRKNYNGKVGVGFCCTYSEAVTPNPGQYDVSGYDYIIISIYPGGGKEDALQRYYNMLVPAISGARNMASKYGVSKVFVGEVGILNLGEEKAKEVFFTAILSEEKEAEFYEKLFATTNNLVDGYSLPYSFYLGVIKGQPAEDVVSKWYGRIS